MATDPKKLAPPAVPPPVDVEAAAAKAMVETLDQFTHNVLLNADPSALIDEGHDEEIIKGNAQHSCGWIHSPGNLELLAIAEQRLTRIANVGRKNAPQVRQVDRIYAKLVPGTKLLVITAAPDSDLGARKVKRHKGESGAWVNLSKLLLKNKLTVDRGFKEKFEIAYVPQESPLWPALVMDLGKPIDRRVEVRKKEEEEEEGQDDGEE